jgi:hypothetical protein
MIKPRGQKGLDKINKTYGNWQDQESTYLTGLNMVNRADRKRENQEHRQDYTGKIKRIYNLKINQDDIRV